MSATTLAMAENYRGKKRHERCKKREQERHKREEVAKHRCRNDVRKFYQKVKRLTEGYKSGASSCEDEKGNLVAGSVGGDEVVEETLLNCTTR